MLESLLFQGFSTGEIAEVLHYSKTKSKFSFMRDRKKLRQILESYKDIIMETFEIVARKTKEKYQADYPLFNNSSGSILEYILLFVWLRKLSAASFKKIMRYN